MAGDMRVNEQPFLTSLHVIFLREHNRVAKLLREYLPRSLQKVVWVIDACHVFIETHNEATAIKLTCVY